jgi:2'-5' RNA ligase
MTLREKYEPHSYATTQAVPPDDIAQLVLDAQKLIDPEDLHEEGFGPPPHVTILYGLHDDERDSVMEILEQAEPPEVTVDRIDLFESDDYDVVIFACESAGLQKLHDELSQLPNDNTHPEYRPHMTIAYVLPGKGDKYRNLKSLLIGKKFVANRLEFSDTTDRVEAVDLRGAPTERAHDVCDEDTPLFGIDLTERPDLTSEINRALYRVLNRSNRRIVSIGPEGTNGASVLLDSGRKLSLQPSQSGDWSVRFEDAVYDVTSPTDIESLAKLLRSPTEASVNDRAITVKIGQNGYDLSLRFSNMPKERPDLQSGTERFDYLDDMLPWLQQEFQSQGQFDRHTIDTIVFKPKSKDWKSLENFLAVLIGWLKNEHDIHVTGVGAGQSLQKPGLVGRALRQIPGVRSLMPNISGGVQDATEDTYTSDVANTTTIPITTGGRKTVKLPGLRANRRRNVRRKYKVKESMSKGRSSFSIVMRPSQISVLADKPVWSALRESGVIVAKPFKMGVEEFFEVTIDTQRTEWDKANSSALLDEVGSVSPQAQKQIMERVDPKIAVTKVVAIITEAAEMCAEAEFEEGPKQYKGWIIEQKLRGDMVDVAKLARHMIDEDVGLVKDFLAGYHVTRPVLELLKALDRPGIAKAAKLLLEDDGTDSSGSLSMMGDPSGASLGATTQGYSEADPTIGEVPGQQTDVQSSSRTWQPGAMFKLNVLAGDAAQWVFRTVVGHEGEGETSELVYRDEAGRVMKLPHNQIDTAMTFGGVVTPEEMNVESQGEIPQDVGVPVSPVANQPPAQVPMATEDVIVNPKTGKIIEWARSQDATEAVAIRKFMADPEVNRCLTRFSRTKLESYALRAADRAAHVASISVEDARRLVTEITDGIQRQWKDREHASV